MSDEEWVTHQIIAATPNARFAAFADVTRDGIKPRVMSVDFVALQHSTTFAPAPDDDEEGGEVEVTTSRTVPVVFTDNGEAVELELPDDPSVIGGFVGVGATIEAAQQIADAYCNLVAKSAAAALTAAAAPAELPPVPTTETPEEKPHGT